MAPPRLRRATETERLEILACNFAEWGSGLPLAGYVAKEDALHAHPWSVAMKSTWVLAEALPNGSGAAAPILSSCEAYTVEATHGATAGAVWEIASVYTAPDLRRRGYANTMLTALVALAKEEGALGLVLFSDIGAPYYKSIGFTVEAECDDVTWPALAGGTAVEGVRLLSGSALRAVVTSSAGAGRDFSIAPNADQLEWHVAQADFFAGAGGRALPSNGASGACIDTDAAATCSPATVWWCPDKTGEELLILWVEGGGDVASLAALILAARRHAGAIGALRVRAWSCAGVDFVGGVPDGTVEHRKGKLPMLCDLRAGAEGAAAARWHQAQRGVWV